MRVNEYTLRSQVHAHKITSRPQNLGGVLCLRPFALYVLRIKRDTIHITYHAQRITHFAHKDPVEGLTAEDREKRLFYALNSGGLYHSFLERLKPRVQRIVRKRFGAAPANAAEADAFMSDLYAHLVEEAAVVLNKRIKCVSPPSLFLPSPSNLYEINSVHSYSVPNRQAHDKQTTA